MKQRLLHLGLWAFATTVLALAFLAYLQPAFMLDLANRIYLCL
ncbi:hypothetical protein [Duganella sp. Root1480D1]|nr:hypothetical protein [Duganella sp. Root1480D1]